MNKLDFTRERVVPNKTPYGTYQEHINRYTFAANYVKDKVVLDIACGTGYGSSYMKSKGAKKIVGADISQDALDYAQMHYNREGITFERLDATKTNYPNNCFDVIVSFETIEHLRDYKKYLEEMQRVLRPGGLFICSTPNKYISSPFTNKPVNPFHFREFYPNEFYTLIQEYFPHVQKYAQLFLRPKDKAISTTLIIGSRMLTLLPFGDKIESLVKKLVLDLLIKPAYLGTDISDEVIDERYRVFASLEASPGTPAYIIVVARKNPNISKIADDQTGPSSLDNA
jgi:ubiquinone/menaquinone biosynthesis C-methylase UbiE